jgi:hypothetical protein
MMEGFAEGKMLGFLEGLTGIKANLDESRKKFEKQFKETMRRFFALDASGSLSRPWLYAVTVYVWLAFECLAEDLWTSSLNQETKLGHQALNSIPNEDKDSSGLSRRQIDVGLAARDGFDLRKSLGTILKSKFDFGKFDGVRSAYKQVFKTYGELDNFPHLRELEQVRHLIVHRGGVADDRFIRLTKIKARPGKPLSLTTTQVANYMISVTLGCASLLKIVDEWFTEEEKKPTAG